MGGRSRSGSRSGGGTVAVAVGLAVIRLAVIRLAVIELRLGRAIESVAPGEVVVLIADDPAAAVDVAAFDEHGL